MKIHTSHTLRYISHLPSHSMCLEILTITQYVLGDTSSTWVCSRNLVSCLVQRVPSAKLLHLDKSAAKTVAIKNPLEQSSLFGCVSSAVTNVNILWLWSLGELLPTPSSLQLAAVIITSNVANVTNIIVQALNYPCVEIVTGHLPFDWISTDPKLGGCTHTHTHTNCPFSFLAIHTHCKTNIQTPHKPFPSE